PGIDMTTAPYVYDTLSAQRRSVSFCQRKREQVKYPLYEGVEGYWYQRSILILRLGLFAVGAPTLWNMLPSSVKSVENIIKFRRHLKTYLYNLAYPP
ncbi:hypothetical protein, partial [endosymbiont of Tevnia jerichonana]|uniref:hypothetical protein n=1 Tax=endosymbiont of Tevnia jerichonana TaxID=94785 RepID=UPI001F11EDBB